MLDRAGRCSPPALDTRAAARAAPAHRQAVPLRLQRRRRRAGRPRADRRAARARRARRGGLPGREDRVRADRAARRTRRWSCCSRSGRRSPAWTCWRGSGSRTLGLQTFLTAGPKEARAWTIPVGATAPQAAGVIHTDFQRGFIKAEIVSYDELVAAGSMAEAAGARQGPHRGQGLRHGTTATSSSSASRQHQVVKRLTDASLGSLSRATDRELTSLCAPPRARVRASAP